MSTTMRPELSAKNEYWIEKHRYYELKHFCLQYPIWKKALSSINLYSKASISIDGVKQSNSISHIEKCEDARMFYIDRMKIIEDATKKTDSFLADYILKAVTEELSYDSLKARYNIPCSKDVYYKLYRRFFWILNKARE